MKIAAFEVRPDEKTSFARWAKVYHADVTEYSEVPSLENASLAAGCVGVTFLGQGKINRELLAEYKNTRTAIEEKYHENKDRMTSVEFWKKYLEL